MQFGDKSRALSIIAGAILLAALGTSGSALAAPGQTAQSAMLTIDSPSTTSFVVTDQFTYSYNKSCADAFFSCSAKKYTWTGTHAHPNTTCSGAADPNPSSLNTSTEIQHLENDNKCIFFSDGDGDTNTVGLLQDTQSDPGTCQATGNSSTKTVISCAVDNATPRTDYANPGDTVTCWDLASSLGTGPTITPAGRAASESALSSSKFPIKYSFSLADPNLPDGVRVQGLTATLTNTGTNTVVQTWSEANSNLTVGLESSGTNFTYLGANGANGTVGLLTSTDNATYNLGCIQENPPTGVPVNNIQGPSPTAGTCASNGTTKDAFAGNNGVGGDLAGYTATAASPELTPGTYDLSVTATLKESVVGLVDLPISACDQVSVGAGQCLQTSTTCP
jgi:hypothetical protein